MDAACKWASPLPLNHGYQIASVRFRRILLVAVRSGEGLLTEHITATQAQPPERVFMCRVSDTGPLMIDPPVLRAGVRKPSGKEPAGGGVGGLLSMGICRGSGLGRGCTGRRKDLKRNNRIKVMLVASERWCSSSCPGRYGAEC
jgi:hypothetical protein